MMGKLERALSPAWARLLALFVLALALSLFAWWPMLAAHPLTQNGDGQAYFKYLEAGRVSITRYHEFPFWNAYECGGNPLWDNPQSFAGSPIIWLAFFVGATRTIEVWIIVHVALGFVSMWLFARSELKLDRMAAFVAAGAWAYSGFHQHHYSGGHLTFAPFLYFPLALLLWRRAEIDRRFAVGLGMLVAWMFYEGAVYPLPHLVILLGLETLTRVWPIKRIPRIALAGAIVGVVALTLAASRLLPVLDQLKQHKRAIPEDVDAMQWQTFKDMFLARAHGRGVPGQQYVWTEFGTYMGPIVIALALAGVLLGGAETLWLFVLMMCMGVLMCGHFSKWSPWTVLHAKVPPFKEMRVPSRFRAETSMFIAAFAGIAVARLTALTKRFLPSRSWGEGAKTAIVALALIGVGDIISVGLTVIEPFFASPQPLPIVVQSPRLYYGGAGLAPFLDQPRQNRGEFSCYDEWGWGQGSHLWEGDVPQARAEDDGAVVDVANRTQNTITVDVTATRPSRILLNTVYDDDWKTDVGKTVNESNQLAIDLPAGHWQVHARVWPRTFTLGVALTAMGMVGTLAFFVWDRRKRSRPGVRG